MKTKPLVLAALVATAVAVSAGSGILIGSLGVRTHPARERMVRIEKVRMLSADVAKAAVRVLLCRASY